MRLRIHLFVLTKIQWHIVDTINNQECKHTNINKQVLLYSYANSFVRADVHTYAYNSLSRLVYTLSSLKGWISVLLCRALRGVLLNLSTRESCQLIFMQGDVLRRHDRFAAGSYQFCDMDFVRNNEPCRNEAKGDLHVYRQLLLVFRNNPSTTGEMYSNHWRHACSISSQSFVQ